MKSRTLIKNILNNVIKKFEINNINKLNKVDNHFNIGLFIRNNYLWGKPNNVKILQKYYNVLHIDDISNKLIFELQKFLKDT